MTQNIYERIHETLTWKRIISFNVVLFLVLIVPLSVSLSQQTTENRSSAAEEEALVTPPPNYPTGIPKIDRVNTFFGKAGDTVVILGANFGDYQWGSNIFVGNTEATKEKIVRWSNTIIEVEIPEGARTGQVWIAINGKEARWEGSLLLYDVARAAQIGIEKTTATTGNIYALNAAAGVSGLVELSYVSEPIGVEAYPGIVISATTPGSDSLGKKLKIQFESPIAMNSGKTIIGTYTYPGLGSIEIIRAEIKDQSGKLIPIFSDPLSIKVTP